MKLINKSGNGLSHTLITEKKVNDEVIKSSELYTLPMGATADIPDEVAKIWLNIQGVEKYLEQGDVDKAAKAAEDKAKVELEALKAENAELKKKLAELDKAAKAAKKPTTK